VDIKGYSGQPLITLVGLDAAGVITGARVIQHSEPILLVGIPEQAMHDFVAIYEGKPALQRIVVGRTQQPGALSVDAISGATVTVLAQNMTIIETARNLGAEVGIFSFASIRPGHFIHEGTPWSFERMLRENVLQRLTVDAREIGMSDSPSPHVDLYFGIVDATHIGIPLLGERNYAHHIKKLAAGEHLLAVFNAGSASFKGSAFVRGGTFDRIRIRQGPREITFRDTDYVNFPEPAAADAPRFNEGALFVLRNGRFDPSESYDLVFLGSRYDLRSGLAREFYEFAASHQLPTTLYRADPEESGLPWRQAWVNRSSEALILGIYLVFVIGVFAARRYTTADPKRIQWLHMASLAAGFLFVGIYLRAQPSVTQIFTLQDSVLNEWRWGLFLSEPTIFMLWLFIFLASLVWGRGLFCGWVCPYGALNRLSFAAGRKLGLPVFELPMRAHTSLRWLRYAILIVLCVVYLEDSVLAERMAEIEPFKSTFLVPAWGRPRGYLAWWLLLFLLAFVVYRPFCRYLCPLGAGLAILGSRRISPPRRRVFCSACNVCSRECLPRAIRSDGTINARVCLSCMNCEAIYRNSKRCPPLIGLERLAQKASLTPAEEVKARRLAAEVLDT
jgi:NosR/NirI family nitrous oxide reductase transcriptional regulator